MALNLANLILLRDELLAGHPVTGAYDADDFVAAQEVSALNVSRFREFVFGGDILKVTDDTEFSALTDTGKTQWLALCGVVDIDVGSGAAKSLEADLFGAGTTTRTSLATLRSETVSQAAAIGIGSIVGQGDVEDARGL